MSNLVLSRKGGESLRFEIGKGFHLFAEVQEVDFDRGVRIRLHAEGLERVETVRMGRSLVVVDGITITAAAIAFKQVRLSIEAPLNVKILRAELVGAKTA